MAESWSRDPVVTSDWSRIMRNTIGWENKLMVDANQKWGVQQVGDKSGNTYVDKRVDEIR